MLLGFMVVLVSSATCVLLSEFSTQNPMIMDEVVNDIDVVVDNALSLIGVNETSTGNDTIDVEDTIVNINGTVLNGTDGNSTLSNGTEFTTKASMNPECLAYKRDKYWRLNASVKKVRHYMCVCYRICYAQEVYDRLAAESQINITRTNVFERNSYFTFYLMFILYILEIVFGTLCNILVIVGILAIMKDKSVVNRFVVSLAVADLFMSMFITPIKLLYLVEVMRSMKETWLCKLMLYMRQVAQTEAIVILTIIGFERYYAICHPLKAKFRCSMKRCYILIAISWIIALTIALPSVLYAEYRADRAAGAICTIHYDDVTWLQLHYVYFFAVLLVIPTGIMTYAYIRICYVLWQSTKKAAELTNQDAKDNKTPSDVQARIKVIKTMVCLLAVFLVCWGPRLTFNMAQVYYVMMAPTTRYYGDLIVELLANGHSVVNPVMFIAFSLPFRQALGARLPSWCCCSKFKGAPSAKSSGFSGQTMSSTDMKSTVVNGSTHM